MAEETREGEVYRRLLTKLEEERRALGGAIFDILGQLFSEVRLRDLLIDAIRYGDAPETRQRLEEQIDNLTDTNRCRELISQHGLAADAMDQMEVRQIRDDLERAQALRLQPHFIESFFLDAFRRLGGSIFERESRRYEITHVPAAIRQRDRQIGWGAPVIGRYERVTFERGKRNLAGKPVAAFVTPGHPLLAATIDLILERYRELLRQGAVLVDPQDSGDKVRALFYLEHSIRDGRMDHAGNRRVISKQLQFVSADENGIAQAAGPAPFLDYRPATKEELELLHPFLEQQEWLRSNVEASVVGRALETLVPEHLSRVRQRKEQLVTKTLAAVKDRLTKEISYWDRRANDLKDRELAGRVNANLNSAKARQRADELQGRLSSRLAELEQERQIAALPPVVVGGCLVAPLGLLRELAGNPASDPLARKLIEEAAMAAVMEREKALGHAPENVSDQNLGYDIQSRPPDGGHLRFIEVKGRTAGSETVSVTRNEMMVGFNEPDQFILAVVEVDGAERSVHYVRRPFDRQPGFAEVAATFRIGDLLTRRAIGPGGRSCNQILFSFNKRQKMKKKLIEVALPLEAINRLSAEEKAVPRRGHPQTIHVWWARRPLAACRAVLFASLIDDPSSSPEKFPTDKAQSDERQRLFGLIEKLVTWENSSGDVIAEARAEILRSCGGIPPAILDPFCGAGSIPLEAQRLGLEAYGADLNPVAVLITRSLIEIPQSFAGAPAVNLSTRTGITPRKWHAFQGLAADVRSYGDWVKQRAEEEIGHLCPRGPAGERPLGYQWARTTQCPNPACLQIVPLTTTYLLAQSKRTSSWVRPVFDRATGRIEFKVESGSKASQDGTVSRNGAVCPWCSGLVSFDYIRSQGKARRLGFQLMAVLAEDGNGRIYLEPAADQEGAANLEAPTEVLETDIPEQALGFRIQLYGMIKHRDLFTSRQLVSLLTFSRLVAQAREKVFVDAQNSGLPGDSRRLSEGGRGAAAYADAIAVYLSLAVSRLATYNNTICHWNIKGGSIQSIFSRQAIPMSWDFMEICPFADFSGNWAGAIAWISDVLMGLLPGPPGKAEQHDAIHPYQTRCAMVSTDPPYYDNIGYADLSDFFYVWLRKSLASVYPDLFSTLLVPKKQELIASQYRHGGEKSLARKFFEDGLKSAFAEIRAVQDPSYPMTIYYAFKQTETKDDETGNGAPVGSTGWESLLESSDWIWS